MQPVINAPEIATVRGQQLFNSGNFYVFIYNRTENISGLHQHDYCGFILVLTGCYFQEANGKRVLLEWGDLVFISLGSHHQSFYKFGVMCILNVGTSRHFFEQHHLPLLPYYFIASQVYRTNDIFLTYVETVISSLNFRETGLEELVEMIIFYVISRLRHYHEEQVIDDMPQWLKSAIEETHGKEQFSESVLENVVTLPAKPQEYLTRVTQRYYGKAPIQIVNEIRINFAKKQLEMTNYSVTGIAFEAGCSSPGLFTKMFKRLASFTSKDCREKLTKSNQ